MEVRAGRWGNGGEVGREGHRIEGWYNMIGETSSPRLVFGEAKDELYATSQCSITLRLSQMNSNHRAHL